MKKFILILIASIGISFYLSAQSAGDYRSVSSGNWNDPAKWEIYNGNSWITASTYPGQNSGSGAVTISIFHVIRLIATVPYPITSLLSDQLNYYPPEGGVVSQKGVLTFSSVNPVTLTVSQDVVIHGELRIDDQNGIKNHTLSVGRSLVVGTKIICDDCYICEYIPATFQTINHDDKLGVVFTGFGLIDSGSDGIEFQDISFNGGWLSVITPVYIRGNASFLSGIVEPLTEPIGHSADCQIYYTYRGLIYFHDGATVSGGSNTSFVDGPVSKEGNDPFTFPIGNGNVYAPLTISAPGSPDARVAAMYVRSDASSLGPIRDPGVFNVSNCEYWDMSASQINNSLDVTVGWSDGSSCESSPYITDVSDVTLAHFKYDGWNWDSHGGSGIGSATSGTVTWNDVTVFGTFTLANLSVCNAPWGLATNITANSASISWPAVMGALGYDVDYKSYTSSEWLNVATSTSSTSLDLTGLSPWMYYDWRIRTNCNSSSSSYAKRQFQTLCGPPSGLTTSNVTHNSATLSWSAIANWVSYNIEYKQSTSGTWIPAATGISSPSYILQGLAAGVAYDWRVLVNCTVSIQGGYSQSSFTTLQAPPPPPPVCNDVYEFNNSSSQAKTISLAITIPAIISLATDVDWFKVITPNNANTTLEVRLTNLPADYDLYVYSKSLKLVGSSVNTGTSNEVVVYNSNAKKATYYIKVVGKNGAYNSSQCYNLLAQGDGEIGSIARASEPVNGVTEDPNKQLLYPNPASEFVYLNFNSVTEGFVNIQIVNSIGQLVKQHPVNTIKGHNQIKIQVADIRPGMYILRINKGDLNLTRKFIIVR